MLGLFIKEKGDNPFNCSRHNLVYKNSEKRYCHYCGIMQQFTWNDERTAKEWRTRSPNDTLHLFANYKDE